MLSRIACAAAVGLLGASAHAATHIACVGNAAELNAALSALSASASNNDDDDIRIRAGTYVAPPAGFLASVTTHHNLTIRGGWTDAGCTQQDNDAARTILDGNATATALTIDTPLIPNSDITVSGLTFRNGHGAAPFNSSAGGLRIGDPNPINGGNVLVERNIFSGNVGVSGNSAVGGLLVATDGTSLIVRGNLFVGNMAPDAPAAFLYSNNAIDFSNNTLTGNLATDTMLAARVTLGFFTFGGLKSTNNIYWGNASGVGFVDVDFANGPVTTRNDDIEFTHGAPATSSGALHADPQFIGNGDFRLSHLSPLIDAGLANPDGGSSIVDIDGAARVDGSAIDVGAYESNFVFVGGFE